MQPDANPTWSHPTLGSFEYDGIAWVTVIDADGFDAFTLDADDAQPPGRYELAFYADDVTRIPTDAAAAMAVRVIAAHATLPAMIANALWDDFNGRGPRSPMWWHGNLDEVLYNMEDVVDRPLASAEDVAGILSLDRIAVHEEIDGDATPVVELVFHAPFESEHGVGVLTDGERVFGTGYVGDLTRFEE